MLAGWGLFLDRHADRHPIARWVRRYRLDLFGLLWLPHAWLVGRFWSVADDAYISFRFSRHFAEGHGLRFNLGDHTPVEGYSNFLWVVMGGVVEWLGLDIVFWMPLISAACASLLLFAVFDFLRRRSHATQWSVCAATLALGCFAPFALWSTGGMATAPTCLLVFLVFERLVLREDGPDPIGGAIVALLLALVRFEGVFWVVVIVGFALLSRAIAGRLELRAFIRFGVIFVTAYSVYFAWRYSYYGYLLPNTAYVKGDLPSHLWRRGFDYVAAHYLIFLSPFALFLTSLFGLARRRFATGAPTVLMAWAFPIYAVVVTGDFMLMGRFLVPAMAFQAVLLGWTLDDLSRGAGFRPFFAGLLGACVLVLGALPAWNVVLIPNSFLDHFAVRRERRPPHDFIPYTDDPGYADYRADQVLYAQTWGGIGTALAQYAKLHYPGPTSLVLGNIGSIGYQSRLFIYDLNGLVTPEVAHREIGSDEISRAPGHDRRVDWHYFLKNQPTFVALRRVNKSLPVGRHAEATRIIATLKRLAKRSALTQDYVPDYLNAPISDTSEPAIVWFFWRHVSSSQQRADAWDNFAEKFARDLREGRAPKMEMSLISSL